MTSTNSSFQCPTCGHTRHKTDRVPGERLRPSLVERIRADHPSWDGSFTCKDDVRRYRMQLVRDSIETQRGKMGSLDASVLERMEKNQLLSRHLQDPQNPLGGRAADAVASFGGSWTFVGLFAAVLIFWMATNAFLLTRPFDPYPFILLNLVLSCLAAVQAPIIMMSQNRQEAKDRDRAENDYEVNLKAELEVELLHEKLDHLLLEEWQRLLEIQEIQLDMLAELAERKSSKELKT